MNALLRRGLVLASASVLSSCGGEPPTPLEPGGHFGAVQLQLDASLIAFHSCCDLNQDNALPRSDVFLYDVAQETVVSPPGLNSATASDTDPAITNDGGLIAFASDRRAAGNVFLYDVNAQTLVDVPGLNRLDKFDGNPSISGDARFIAFESDRSGNGNVFLYDRDRERLVGVPGLNSTTAFDGEPSISDDGRFIAFFSTRYGAGNVFLYDRNQEGLRSLPGLNSPSFFDRQPALSGDGRFIAFSSDRVGGDLRGVFLYDREIGALVPTPGLPTARGEPALSSDGGLLLFVRFDPEHDFDDPDVFAYEPATSTVDPLPALNDHLGLFEDGGPAL